MRYTPTDITSTYAAITALNVNFDDIQTLLEKCVFTDGTPPNAMEADFDMNHFNIKNVADAVNPTDAINLEQATSLIGGVTLSGDSFSSRALMAIANAPVLNQTVLLAEKGREGNFVVDLASNWTAAIAADTAQGLFVPSTADATKVYVRKFGNSPYNPTWWGMVSGDNAANASANTTAWQAMIATLVAASANYPSSGLRGLGHVKFPEGIFWMGDAGAGAAIDLQDGAIRLEGSGNAFDEGGIGTLIKLSGAITGIRVQSGDTSGATLTGQSHASAAGTSIRELAILGNYTTTESEAHGIHLRATATVDSVRVDLMPGDGFQVVATTSANNGNANLWQLKNCTASNCRNGFFMDGSDANAGTATGCFATGSRQWDFFDSSFLGNTFVGCLAESFGNVVSPFAAVSSGGNQYAVIPGQEIGASTNAPSGTTADNTWWHFLQAGGVGANFPAWTSGASYRAGGTYHNDNLNQKNSIYIGCYDESNGTRSWLGNPAIIVGGFLALQGNPAAGNGWGPAASVTGNDTGGGLRLHNSLHITPSEPANAFVPADTADLFYGGQLFRNTVWGFTEPALAPGGYAMVVETSLGRNDLELLDLVGDNSVFQITLPGSTAQFGTGAAQKNSFYPANLVVGSSLANARLLSNATAAPNATAAGQVYFNLTPSATGPVGWIAQSGSAASPQPATPFYSGLGTNPIGYTTGAGGVVTQATSKSTGVTLNKLCGQITMNGAALAASTSVAFTLTNSQIAAADTVIVTIASGATTNSYLTQVEATAAGSCRIQLRNVSAGSLSEAVVLNFAVIKAVNA